MAYLQVVGSAKRAIIFQNNLDKNKCEVATLPVEKVIIWAGICAGEVLNKFVSRIFMGLAFDGSAPNTSETTVEDI